MILLYGTILNHSRSASRLPIGEMMWIQDMFRLTLAKVLPITPASRR